MDAIDFFNGTAGAANAAPAVPLKHTLFSYEYIINPCRKNVSAQIDNLTNLFVDYFL